jgi:uncharacterized Zn finger protein
MAKQRKEGRLVAPVVIAGRKIANTFWGLAWCDNLEHYSDFANRLPRGRTYVRNGSVVDLQIRPGLVEAQVSGSSLYRVRVKVQAVPAPHWQALCKDCGGAIESLVELLQGRFSRGVMERLCRQGAGLFPTPKEIAFSCSCPDGAYMCKHVAAVLYGIGARLDTEPELLFRLRAVDGQELLARAAAGLTLAAPELAADRVLGGDGLEELFGLDLGVAAAEPAQAAPRRGPKAKAARPEVVAEVRPARRGPKPKAARPEPANPIKVRGKAPADPLPEKAKPKAKPAPKTRLRRCVLS